MSISVKLPFKYSDEKHISKKRKITETKSTVKPENTQKQAQETKAEIKTTKTTQETKIVAAITTTATVTAKKKLKRPIERFAATKELRQKIPGFANLTVGQLIENLDGEDQDAFNHWQELLKSKNGEKMTFALFKNLLNGFNKMTQDAMDSAANGKNEISIDLCEKCQDEFGTSITDTEGYFDQIDTDLGDGVHETIQNMGSAVADLL